MTYNIDNLTIIQLVEVQRELEAYMLASLDMDDFRKAMALREEVKAKLALRRKY